MRTQVNVKAELSNAYVLMDADPVVFGCIPGSSVTTKNFSTCFYREADCSASIITKMTPREYRR